MNKVVAAIIEKQNNLFKKEYLLVKNVEDYGSYADYWGPPAGHVEPSEDEVAAVIREVKEETNLDILNVTKVVETIGDLGEIVIWFRCQIMNLDVLINKKEIKEYGFFTKEKMVNLKLWPATKYYFDKYE